MDSLFDASLFDAPKAAVVVDPPEPAPSLFDLLESEAPASSTPNPLDEAGPSAVDPSDTEESSTEAVTEPVEDVDVTEVLNDPDWEPPVDDILVEEEVAVEPAPRDLSVDGPSALDAPAEDVLVAEIPVAEIPVAEASVEEVPGEDVRVADTSLDEVPAEDALFEGLFVAEAPQAQAPPSVPRSELPDADALVEDTGVEDELVEDVGAPEINARAPRTTEELSPEDVAAGRATFWSEVVGQDSAVALLQASVPKPVHAYLFVGAPGSGKQAAAVRFGAALVCAYGGCGRCNACARALIGAHPDVMVVEREGASISVDQAREIIRLAARAPLEGDRKVLVLVDFHLVTQAAPTLLKIIEEPPPSTVFVVLAEQVTAELVTIASRCVTVGFAPLSAEAIARALVAEGHSVEVAEKSASASGGRLDRARLLASDPALGQRMSFWQMVPNRLNGTGAAVSVLADDAVALLDAAAVGPLEARQASELAVLEARLEATGGRGGIGQRKELLERHKRELKRLRDDEVRLGLGVIQQTYRETLSDPAAAPHETKAALVAIGRINTANEQLVRNPNLNLWFRALFLDLPGR